MLQAMEGFDRNGKIELLEPPPLARVRELFTRLKLKCIT